MDSAKNDPHSFQRSAATYQMYTRWRSLPGITSGRKTKPKARERRAGAEGMMMESLPAPELIAIVLCVALWAALRKTHGS